MSHAHKHGDTGPSGHGRDMIIDADARFLAIALALILGFMVVEVSAGVLSGSLALLADAGHMLIDAGALGASLWAARLAARPAHGVWTYGYKRAEILSAAINGITLLVVSALITVEASNRRSHPASVEGRVVVAVALLGVVVNVVAAWVLAKANRTSLNVEGSFQHILTDLYAFIATLIAGVIIILTGFGRADALASLVVVALMLKAAWTLLKASGRILLEAAPDNVNLDDVRAHLLGIDHVCNVHDLHAWTVTSSLPALSAHVVLDDACFSEGEVPHILDELQDCLIGHFDVEHSTFQMEPSSHLDHESGMH